jgi:hypothetical protein
VLAKSKTLSRTPSFSAFQIGTPPIAMEMFGTTRLSGMSTITKPMLVLLLAIPLNDHGQSILCNKMKIVRILRIR